MNDRTTTETVQLIDQLFHYALACAARADDFRQRDLGPIHLLKYAYLADVAYAERHDGATYTGIDWKFYHFGPWSGDAYARITPSLERIGAVERVVSSSFRDDYIRYRLSEAQADQLVGTLDQTLPLDVSGVLARAVHEHGSDTADLLRHVYLTPPMLAARPNESLDFTTASEPREPAAAVPPVRRTRAEKRRRAAKFASARTTIQRLAAERRSTRVAPDPTPRYDDVFFEGLQQLDREAGVPLRPSSGTLSFDESLWASSQRRDPDIP